jgi:PAS domain S-box-containing protein
MTREDKKKLHELRQTEPNINILPTLLKTIGGLLAVMIFWEFVGDEFLNLASFWHHIASIIIAVSIGIGATYISLRKQRKLYQRILSAIIGRKQTEIELLNEKNQLKTIIDSSPVSIWYKDTKNKFIRVNKVATKIADRPVEEIEGHSTDEIFPVESAKFYADDMEVINSGIPKLGIIESVTSNGINNWLRSDKLPWYDADGNIAGVIVFALDITQHKQAEDALNESVELFQGLFNASPDAIVLINPHDPIISWPIVDCNEAACLMNGYTREELIGHSIDLLNTSVEKPEERITYFEFLRKNGTLHIETNHRHKDGHIISVEVSTSLVTIGGRELVLGIDRDITERKRTEESLNESQQIFQKLAQISPVGIFRTSADGYTTYVNPRWLELSGLSFEKAMGHGWINAVHPDDRELVNKNWIENNKIQQTSNAEYRFLRPDGSIVWIIGNAVPEIKDNIVKGFIGTITDITERKLAEEAIQHASDELKNLYDNLDDAIFSFDTVQNKMLQVSIAHEAVFGYPPAAFYKNPQLWYELVIPEDKPIVDAGYPNLWAGKNLQHEFRIIRPDGQLRWIEVRMRPTLDKNGTLIRIDGIASDITERKQMIDDLIASKGKAEESDTLKSAFLANMSHEIRTPLNSIIGFSDLLLDPFFGLDEHFEFAGIIKENGNNLLAIISDIMDLSKIESGQAYIKRTIFSVNQLTNNIQKEYSYKASAKGIELRLDPTNPEEEVFIESDENKIRQILVNFVSNAIKFTKDGFIEIGIKITGDAVQFHVKDTGIGIPAEYTDTIFERFRQVESAHTRKYGGNGLGLPISKSLVELLGGRIWVESEKDKGSTFYFTVPKY